MKRLLVILISLLPLFAIAQIVEPVKWSGEMTKKGVHISATIDEGYDLHVTEVNGEDVLWPDDELEGFVGQFDTVLADVQQVALRFRTCSDVSCVFGNWDFNGEGLALIEEEEELTEEEKNVETITMFEDSTKNKKDSSTIQVTAIANEFEDEAINSPLTISDQNSLLWIFIWGLLGGLLAIFTPCVWPIIPMTVSFFLKRTDKGGRNAFLYGLSIIVLYLGLGLFVTILFGASALNELSTNAIVNIFFFLLLVVFALSFFGLFEITLPDSWSTALDSKARSTGGFLSILLMAFTLVIVSFSCTGPIIGTLLVEAAGHSLLAPTVGMLGFAIALALPFSLFAMFPQWLKKAPKSGDWMTAFKVVLAFLELALSLKFLSVADLAYGWGILPRWLFIAIWVACFMGIGIYLLWNYHRVTLTRRVIRAVVIIPSLMFAGYLIPGVFGAPVKLISAFAPPMDNKDIDVFNDYEEGMVYAREHNMPVIIDFTGYGCVNCREMEAYVLDDARVKRRLKNYVFIKLYVDEKRDGIGDKNSRIQREQFGSNAQPYYVQLDANGKQVAKPMAFTTDPKEFLNWLKY